MHKRGQEGQFWCTIHIRRVAPLSALCKFLQQSHPPGSVLVPIHVRPVAPGQFCASSCNRLFFEEGSSPARAGNDSSSFWIVARLLRPLRYTQPLRKFATARGDAGVCRFFFQWESGSEEGAGEGDRLRSGCCTRGQHIPSPMPIMSPWRVYGRRPTGKAPSQQAYSGRCTRRLRPRPNCPTLTNIKPRQAE